MTDEFAADLAAIAAGLCDKRRETACRNEAGDDEILAWMCEKCELKRFKDLGPYTLKLLGIRRMRMAGYPFGKNDLSLEDWIDLARVEEALVKWQTRTP